MHVLVVTGLSGAGKSTALSALADVGYVCVDNLPLQMLPALVEVLEARGDAHVAVGIDARDRGSLSGFVGVREAVDAHGRRVEVLFLDASDEVLVRRFSETRRLHPLGRLPDALVQERKVLAGLRREATQVVDSSTLKVRQLRTLVRERYGAAGVLTLSLMSFGFKHGLPVEADLVFDARFLDNPYDFPELRPQSGFDAPVRDFVLGQADAVALADRIEDWIRFQVPRSMREGRAYLTVAIGCTGGQHRSVALVCDLEGRLQRGAPLSAPAPAISSTHRDVQSGGFHHAK